MQRKSSARNRAVTESQQGAALAQGLRAGRDDRAPAPPASARMGSGEMTLGGHADRGLTLAALYDTGVLECLRLEVRVRLISDLTQSLAWLHANPRLMASHRHLLIAPSTVVIGLDGVARLDVRSAKKQETERSELETDYSAPEVQNGDPAADQRADIFSIGVLAWEALAGRRLSSRDAWGVVPARSSDARDGAYADLPVAFGGGRSSAREPAHRKATARAIPKSSHRRMKTAPTLALPAEADWAMPFAALALQAMSPDPSDRPQDCRELLAQLELIASRMATNQEIAEVVQGISAVATLCVPEPTLPDTDAVCQGPGPADGMKFMDREACSDPQGDNCMQRLAPALRRVPEPVATAAAIEAPPAAPLPAAAPLVGWRRWSGGYSGRAWFVAGLLWLAVFGSLAGYVASVLAVR